VQQGGARSSDENAGAAAATLLPVTEAITLCVISLMEAITLSHGLQMGDALIAAIALDHGLPVLTAKLEPPWL
jgi:predicted nucleic acid-binding protein